MSRIGLLLIVACVAGQPIDASAGITVGQPITTSPVSIGAEPGCLQTPRIAERNCNCGWCLAKRKSAVAAQASIKGHVLRSQRYKGFEGTGWGPNPTAAIRNCCFFGKRPLRYYGVTRSRDGLYYACCFFD